MCTTRTVGRCRVPGVVRILVFVVVCVHTEGLCAKILLRGGVGRGGGGCTCFFLQLEASRCVALEGGGLRVVLVEVARFVCMQACTRKAAR